MKFLYLILSVYLINFVSSHSWLSCTDYNIDNPYSNQKINYNLNSCKGYPRNYNSQFISDKNRGFGFDTGYNTPGESCAFKRNLNENSPEIPIASYKSGQQVCLTYPSKNHVADTCTNQYIPDNGIKIYRSSKSNEEDFNTEYPHLNGIHVNGQIDYKGFQNCPGFCDNPDKTVCYVCFNLESNIEPGTYSFKWVWEFNNGDYYSSCWDAAINSDQTSNSITTQPNIINKPTESINNQNNQNSYKYDSNNLCKKNNNPNVPINNPTNTQTNTPSSNPSLRSNDKAKVWDQCSGNGMKPKDCQDSVCIKYSQYYGQCLPFEMDYGALCGQKDNKEINWIHKCKSNMQCKSIGGTDYRCM
jgi:hypothetical protein